MNRSKWQIVEQGRKSSVGEVLEALLKNRGVGTSFLHAALEDLEPHLAIRGMHEGAELMARHLAQGHKVVLIGDYDCDGITSLAQMSLFLKDIGYGSHRVVIPLRAEGYGIPDRAISEHPDARLFVVMDCGTQEDRAVARVRELGADCIVIDHHQVPENGPAPATVLINPKQPACDSVFKEFCSAGLTLLFLARLRKAVQGRFPVPSLGGKYLALAAIGTVADIVPLVDGNRILVKHGLRSINRRSHPPIEQLVRSAGLSGKTLTAGHLGFQLGPRLNAAGRIADARTAFDLLVADHPGEIGRLADELNRLNTRRQYLENEILAGVRQRLLVNAPRGRTLMLGDPQWPSGIVGILASKIQQELHYGPVIVFSMDEEKGVARGSGRSVPGFDIHLALKSCDDLLVKWGGHKMAAGLTVRIERMKELEKRFEEAAADYPPEVFFPRGRVDMELDLDLVGPELISALKELEPYGAGNPAPTFAVRGIRVSNCKTFGRDQNHLRLLLDNRAAGIFWRGANLYPWGSRNEGGPQDVIFQVEWDDFCGRPVLNIKDLGRIF